MAQTTDIDVLTFEIDTGTDVDVEKGKERGSLKPVISAFMVSMPDGSEVVATLAAEPGFATVVKDMPTADPSMAKLWCPFRQAHC